MASILFHAIFIAYSAACFLYFRFLLRGSSPRNRAARATLVLGAVFHLAFLIVDAGVGRVTRLGIHDVLLIVSLLVVVVFVATSLRSRYETLGAFVTPAALLMFIGARFGQSVQGLSDDVRGPLQVVHIGANVVGLVAFTLGAAASVAYLLQEYQLRKKRLSGLFQRLPSLDATDDLAFKCLLAGFPLFTLGVLTGVLWATRLGGGAFDPNIEQVSAFVAWICFGAVLLLRAVVGWRGRRAAIGTLIGYACALFVLVNYVFRGDSP